MVSNVIEKKWLGVLPLYLKLRWNNVWDKERISKEVGLIRMIWYLAIVVNEWRRIANPMTPQGCLVCRDGSVETALHRFWECRSTCQTWKWGVHIIQIMQIEHNKLPRPNAQRHPDDIISREDLAWPTLTWIT